MKAFQTICRPLRSSKGFPVKPVALVGFATCYLCGRKKKVNPYEKVDQSVLSFRGLVHTPESLLREVALLCGPVCKRKPPKQEEEQSSTNWFPIFNPEESVKPNASDPSIPLKIPLQRNVIPGVTQILKQTMRKQQTFYLERWKRKLGEDGFREYTSSLWSCVKNFKEALNSVKSPQGNLRGRDENLESGYIESVQHILKDVSGVPLKVAQHETLKYTGLLDCVAEYQHCGLIVVAYKDKSPAPSHVLDAELCSHCWAKCLLQLEEYTGKNRDEKMQKID
uniref:Mitochondrial genome maintenance exonuclease 1 n=1 Tax=Otolemur garnettii TaxID=30611 RepID=H0XVT4_OTOGA